MYRLPFIIVFVATFQLLSAQNSNIHGEGFKVDCKACHTADGWDVKISDIAFNHQTTSFPLEGQHQKTDCKACHESLIFTKAENDCFACHADVHSMSVGNDCVRCHSTNNWLVDYIPELHEQNGFPLLGAHTMLSCVDCHQSETNLRWDRLGNDCASCHMDDFNQTTDPNHASDDRFFVDCDQCHAPIALDWGAGNFHFFFSLTLGHNVKDCDACHNPNDFGGLNGNNCFGCHETDYNNADDPVHTSQFGTDCARCHTTNPGWRPANFDHSLVGNECISCHQDDYNNQPSHIAQGFSTECAQCHTNFDSWYFNHEPLFPIYSGEHKGKWNECTDCHLNPNDYSSFSCIVCHSNQQELAKKHEDEKDYVFNDNACYECHPDGKEE